MNQIKPVGVSVLIGLLVLSSGCGSSDNGGDGAAGGGPIAPPVVTSITISGVCNEPSVVVGTAVANGGAAVGLTDSDPHPSVWSLTIIPEVGDTAVQVQTTDGADNPREYTTIVSMP